MELPKENCGGCSPGSARDSPCLVAASRRNELQALKFEKKSPAMGEPPSPAREGRVRSPGINLIRLVLRRGLGTGGFRVVLERSAANGPCDHLNLCTRL